MSFQAMAWAVDQRPPQPTDRLVLLHLASMANEKGAAWPSYQYLADVCGISRSTVLRCMKRLEEARLVTKIVRPGDDGVHSSNVYLLATGGVTRRDPAGGGGVTMTPGVVSPCHQGGVTMTPGGGVTVTPRNSHSSETVIETIPQSEPEGFAEWYAQYPRKIGRKDALKAFKQVKADQETLLANTMLWSQYWAAEGKDERFIPYPATFLRKGYWEDRPPEVSRERTNADINEQYLREALGGAR